MFAIRINDHRGYKEIIQSIFQGNRFTKVLCVEHEGRTGENIHYHLTVKTDYKQQALRAELKKHFILGKGNSHMSIKVWDGDIKANSYLFHEKHTCPIIINKGYDTKQIESFKLKCEEIKNVIIDNTPLAICKVITDQLIKSHPPFKGSFASVSKETVCFALWDYYKSKGDWFPNKFQLERYVMKIQEGYCQYYDTFSGTPELWLQQKQSWFAEMFPTRNY